MTVETRANECQIFREWCARALPPPHGTTLAQLAETQGMLAAVAQLERAELIAWMNRRAYLAAQLGRAFVPDTKLDSLHFYEWAGERLKVTADISWEAGPIGA
jgi:hypothetical protein